VVWAPVPTPVAAPVAIPDSSADMDTVPDPTPSAIALSQIEPTQSLFSCDTTCSTSALLETSS
jgi:hypothetical protein